MKNDNTSNLLDIKQVKYGDGDESFIFKFIDGEIKSFYSDDSKLLDFIDVLKKETTAKIKNLSIEKEKLSKEFYASKEYHHDKILSVILTILTKISFITAIAFLALLLLEGEAFLVSLIIGGGFSLFLPNVGYPKFKYENEESLKYLKADEEALKSIQKHLSVRIGKTNEKDPLADENNRIKRINVIREIPENEAEFKAVTKSRKRKSRRLDLKITEVSEDLSEISPDVPSVGNLKLFVGSIYKLRHSRLEKSGEIMENTQIVPIALEVLKKRYFESQKRKLSLQKTAIDNKIEADYYEKHLI